MKASLSLDRLGIDRRAGAARIAAPFARLQAALHLAGAENYEIAAADFHVLRLGDPVELVVGNAVAVLEIVDAPLARHVEQHAAPHHLGARVLDAELGKS